MLTRIIRYSFFVCVAFFLGNCSATKVVSDPTGDWEFTVSGTPYGAIKGTMKISAVSGNYVAKMKAMGDELEMNPMKFDPKTGKATGTFSFQGNSVNFEAVHSSGALNGNLSASGADFPFQAAKLAGAGSK